MNIAHVSASMSNNSDFPPTAFNALNELIEWRADLRRKIADRLEPLDPTLPETLQYATKAMLEAHYEPIELSNTLGVSRTTIGRWANGQTIPRSPAFRKWSVDRLLAHLHQPKEEKQNRPESERKEIADFSDFAAFCIEAGKDRKTLSELIGRDVSQPVRPKDTRKATPSKLTPTDD